MIVVEEGQFIVKEGPFFYIFSFSFFVNELFPGKAPSPLFTLQDCCVFFVSPSNGPATATRRADCPSWEAVIRATKGSFTHQLNITCWKIPARQCSNKNALAILAEATSIMNF